MALRFWRGCFTALLLLVLAGRTQAGLLPVSASVQNDNGSFRYTYGVVLTSDSTLKSGDFFTVYDFQGMVNGSAVAPAGFTMSAAAKGMTPVGTTPVDDASKPNLTWTYSGPTITGQVGLGNFSVLSIDGPNTNPSSFTGQTHRQVDGKLDSNITSTDVPGVAVTPAPGTGPGPGPGPGPGTSPGPGPTPGVPEPASLALLGIGLPLAGAFRYLRRRKS